MTTTLRSGQTPAAPIPAPDWLNDLILYEVATRGYTSPSGPESGTFASLQARLPYLADLGVTGIWLTGHSLAHPTHFYNVWTQYAVIEPDKFDPSLGAEDDFRALVDAAHAHGIKVLLEVVTHGVMNDSPLVREKPHWFKGGSWGMTDFDWAGHIPDLDEWWVELWAGMVERYGIDGFRLDVAVYRWDLWQRIRARAAAGHPIVIVTEHGPGYLGVNDIFQRGSIRLSVQTSGLKHDSPLLTDVAGYFRRRATPHSSVYQVTVVTADGAMLSTADGDARLRIASQQNAAELVCDDVGVPLWRQFVVTLHVEGVNAGATIADVIVTDEEGQEWRWQPWVELDCRVAVEQTPAGLRLHFIEKYPPGQWLAVQLSSHDDGWDGSPLDKNPYVAQGSRFVFGYAFMLTPAVPLFMAGEEFDADYRPLPQHSPRLFGGELFGQGRWLYAGWLDWRQLDEPRHAAMLDDARRLIAIRKRFSHLVRPLRVGNAVDHLLPVALNAGRTAPMPYLYRSDDECLLIAGNPNTDADLSLRFTLPLEALGWDADALLTVTDLWHDTPQQATSAERFAHMTHVIRRDKTPRGGLLVLHLQRQQSQGSTRRDS